MNRKHRFSICVVTTTRADYGILRPLLFEINKKELFELELIVSGTHLSSAFGLTIEEIKADGLNIEAKIPILDGIDEGQNASIVMGRTLERFGAYFEQKKPDLLLVLGDRYEILAVCAAAVNARIPIAHLHGGEATYGLVDESFRHSITKMSYLHFTANEAYRKRVIQLGESPERVFNVGALGVENALHTEFLTLVQLEEALEFSLSGYPYAVVTFHPVTLEENTAEGQLDELLAALAGRRDMRFLITKSNADAGGVSINAMLDSFALQNPHCKVVASLGMRRYMSALKHAVCVIGNSSSGIIEAPAFGIPTVNIGDRQRGRMQVESVINCKPERGDILRAIDRALSPEFKEIAANAKNPYGNGETSKLICEKIEEFLMENKIDLKKKFYDVSFEVVK